MTLRRVQIRKRDRVRWFAFIAFARWWRGSQDERMTRRDVDLWDRLYRAGDLVTE